MGTYLNIFWFLHIILRHLTIMVGDSYHPPCVDLWRVVHCFAAVMCRSCNSYNFVIQILEFMKAWRKVWGKIYLHFAYIQLYLPHVSKVNYPLIIYIILNFWIRSLFKVLKYHFSLSNCVLISKRSFQLLKCMRIVNLDIDCIFDIKNLQIF